MPITIKQLTEDDVNFYPLTHASGVVFADGTYLSNKTFGETNVIETVKVNGSTQTITNKAVDITIPTKTSDLTNDSGFVTSAVSGVKGNSESTYRTGNVNLTAANIGAATSSHTHGNITNAGALQTTDITIASGDKLVVTDSSNSNKVARTSVSFDGSTTTTALTPKGTFETFLKTAPVTSVNGNTGAVTISVPTKVSDLTNDSGFTSNTGTITGITMNGSSKGTSGVVNLGTVLTSHQDISGKENTSNKVTSISSSSTDTQYPSAKCVYNAIQNSSNEWQVITNCPYIPPINYGTGSEPCQSVTIDFGAEYQDVILIFKLQGSPTDINGAITVEFTEYGNYVEKGYLTFTGFYQGSYAQENKDDYYQYIVIQVTATMDHLLPVCVWTSGNPGNFRDILWEKEDYHHCSVAERENYNFGSVTISGLQSDSIGAYSEYWVYGR